MPLAEVIWNGIAKSYRFGAEVFIKGRSRTEDWPKEVYDYLRATKGFTVVDKKSAAPTPPLVKPAEPVSESVAEPVSEPVDEPASEEGEPRRVRGPRGRRGRRS